MRKIEKIESLLPPPTMPKDPGTALEWKEVEKVTSYLPQEYTDFIKAYGTGCINDFIWILSPFSKNHHLNLIKRLPIIINSLKKGHIFNKGLIEKEHQSFYPNEEGLIPFGITDNGDYLLYKPSISNSEQSIIIIDGRLSKIEEYFMELNEFMVKMLTGQIKSRIIPAIVFEGNNTFRG